jgi:Domain of unknown function (DUF3597)
MSIFGKIMSAIFGGSASAASPASGGTAAQPAAQVTPSAVPLAPDAPPAAARSRADVAAIMDELAARSDEDLDWRTSIVDLLKLLEVDSSLAARKQLALELHYAGSLSDAAAMNIWLHRKVMAKLAESGGQVPAELRH